ncbi:MAG TPA: hypothetical protein VH796_00885 [Nitrososphaeraceae archaeon]|jgi:hypothetical protein
MTLKRPEFIRHTSDLTSLEECREHKQLDRKTQTQMYKKSETLTEKHSKRSIFKVN